MTHGEGSRSEERWSDHIPVLLDEVLSCIAPKPGGRYLDGTLGLAGHSEAILDAAGEGAELLGLDRDRASLARAAERLARFGSAAHPVYSRYSEFERVMSDMGWSALDGALLDIGVSSMHLDQPERGFSFHSDGPLDMRMDPGGGMPPASAIVNKASFERLKQIIGRYGEDPMGGRIARAITESRTQTPIKTTKQLAELVYNAYPAKWRAQARNHPATRTFQALRMVVNSELEELETFLQSILQYLRPGGRLVIITFHSLEDRMVKRLFRDEAQGCRCPKQIPVCVCGHEPQVKILTKKPLTASKEELARNARASSAKLRAVEKL